MDLPVTEHDLDLELEQEFERSVERRRKRRRGLIVLLLSLSLSTLGAGAMSLAIFTDSDASSGTWTVGTVDISVNPTVMFNVTAMPGDSGSRTLTVTNGGSASLRYALTSASTNTDLKNLRNQLLMTVKAGTCPGAGADLSSGTGTLATVAFGSTAQGNQAGDRTLAGGGTEDLCFAWSLPLNTPDSFQGATTTTTFTFTAEQTANNP